MEFGRHPEWLRLSRNNPGTRRDFVTVEVMPDNIRILYDKRRSGVVNEITTDSEFRLIRVTSEP
jgi:hypothetical protein